jgi:hypothetical protein
VSPVTRRGQRGERQREEERIGRKPTYFGRISLCIPGTDPAERGFRPDLSNPCTYTGVGSTNPAGSGRKLSRYPVACPILADHPDPIAHPRKQKKKKKKKKKKLQKVVNCLRLIDGLEKKKNRL